MRKIKIKSPFKIMKKKFLFKVKLVIASGKGGVGKSMLSSMLAILFGQRYRVVAIDCDADAPNLALWLNEIGEAKIRKISTSEKPVFDYKKCNGCGFCAQKCRFKAIKIVKGKPALNPFLCEGCGVCEIICPQRAVQLRPIQNGEIRVKETKYDFPLVSGQLYPGESGSGKVVTKIRKEAEKFDYNVQIIDSAPGTGCPVIASLRGSNFAILITEPTLSGFSDLKRVLEVVRHFKIPWTVVINKWDINPSISKRIEKWALNKILGKISYDKEIVKSIAHLKPIIETNLKVKREIRKIFERLLSFLSLDNIKI